ncbi:CheR family methyltransferase [Chitinivorax sp. B]|uniref:CheR family methyltransferase n=1 Tax=Chitinivorax sp. B TaxID=2502235 RepID=UPI0010F4DAF2|nr:CheR family methyltransferase [Chitinivorax sp. B]
MNQPPNPEQVARFRSLLVDRMGLCFDESRIAGLTRTLTERAAYCKLPVEHYLSHLASGPIPQDELGALAQSLTVTETYFLRHADQFSAFVNIALPDRLTMLRDRSRVNVLSFGCASGDEPYSLAIAIREHLPHAASQINITAADINPAMLDKARKAQYSPWSLRDVSPSLLSRWFKLQGNAYMLDPSIVAAVEFEHRNLTVDDPIFWHAGRFDIVFCRNVLMYFTPEQAQAAVNRITQSMVPGGYLFLGHAETLRGLSNQFHVCHTNDAFYYRLTTPPDAVAEPPHRFPATPSWPTLPLFDDSWVAVIQQASERIHTLSTTGPTPSSPVTRISPNLAPVFEHLHRERFGQALFHLDAVAPDHHNDPDIQLLRAVLLVHSGELDQAQAVCAQLLYDNEHNAGAHYVLALCSEGRGDLPGALEQDQLAAYLDPDFAMPHLHMGLIARRSGEYDLSSREMTRALTLLQQEDGARLLLFGGGFQRNMLMDLCRKELTKLGDCR